MCDCERATNQKITKPGKTNWIKLKYSPRLQKTHTYPGMKHSSSDVKTFQQKPL